jgi:hypothetical protein
VAETGKVQVAVAEAAEVKAAVAEVKAAVDSRHRPPPSKLSLPVQLPAGAEEIANPRVATID